MEKDPLLERNEVRKFVIDSVYEKSSDIRTCPTFYPLCPTFSPIT